MKLKITPSDLQAVFCVKKDNLREFAANLPHAHLRVKLNKSLNITELIVILHS